MSPSARLPPSASRTRPIRSSQPPPHPPLASPASPCPPLLPAPTPRRDRRKRRGALSPRRRRRPQRRSPPRRALCHGELSRRDPPRPRRPRAPPRCQGQVWDVYESGEHWVLVTNDRQSAFDRVLASIPFKGQVLNETSLWWFNRTCHITPNAVVSSPDKNVTIAKSEGICYRKH